MPDKKGTPPPEGTWARMFWDLWYGSKPQRFQPNAAYWTPSRNYAPNYQPTQPEEQPAAAKVDQAEPQYSVATGGHWPGGPQAIPQPQTGAWSPEFPGATLVPDLNAATDQLVNGMWGRRVNALTGGPEQGGGFTGGNRDWVNWSNADRYGLSKLNIDQGGGSYNRFGQPLGTAAPYQSTGGPGWSRGGQRVTNKYWTDNRITTRNLSLGKIGAQIKATGIHGDKNRWRNWQPEQPKPQPDQPLNQSGFWQNALINWRY